MTADERLAGVRAKIERANKHISDLDAACRAFCETQEDQVRSRMGSNTGERTYYVQSVRDIPLEIATIAGDAVHNLRSALDHLAYQLVLANENEPTFDTNFPIYKDASDYAKHCVGRTEGMSTKAKARINECKPYRGGNDSLWRLHRLDIINKHRLLVSACLVNASHSMTPSQRAGVNRNLSGAFCISPGLLVATPVRNIPLKAGAELLTVPRPDASEHIKFHFIVGFGETAIFHEPISIYATLQPMAHYVEMITANFKSLLM